MEVTEPSIINHNSMPGHLNLLYIVLKIVIPFKRRLFLNYRSNAINGDPQS